MRNGAEGELTNINSAELVPGDVIEIPEQCFIPCDVILLSGVCVVNESMLTGESIPAIKTPIPFTTGIYNFKTDSKYTLFGGTKVI
jgi:cation-transporting ATPase 13A2